MNKISIAFVFVVVGFLTQNMRLDFRFTYFVFAGIGVLIRDTMLTNKARSIARNTEFNRKYRIMKENEYGHGYLF